MVNPGPLGLFDPTNVWPASASVQNGIDKAAASLGKTTFTCTVVYDPDFRVPAQDADYLFTTTVTNCN